ncbi:hypothetical protein DYB28_003402 [Aphanomyces astaci]|uniref:PPM-type phosphatase domain-containing protein n=1 Tax=Aphanomyces astaci TaxID=112090 RepID=A0A9X8E9H6_APHAT|nr:hypothetical protein DYB28_003402 [Aphanomyces astaci]
MSARPSSAASFMVSAVKTMFGLCASMAAWWPARRIAYPSVHSRKARPGMNAVMDVKSPTDGSKKMAHAIEGGRDVMMREDHKVEAIAKDLRSWSGPPSHLSTSVVNPRPWEWGKYVTPLSREGFLEKQSRKDRTTWKRRWVVMQDNVLYFFKEPFPATNVNLYENDNLLLQLYRHGSIQLDTVVTVCTASLSASITRHIESTRRQHRSQSFDCRDHIMFDQLAYCVPYDEYAAPLRHSIDAIAASSSSPNNTRTPLGSTPTSSSFKSPCTSPNFFPFQLDELGMDEDEEAAAALQLPPSFDELVATTTCETATPITTSAPLPSSNAPTTPVDKPVAAVKRAYVPPHLRKGYVSPPPPMPSSNPPPPIEYTHLHGDSAMHGTHMFGCTSLVGKRPSLEDMICVRPDFSPTQAVYALFDGHSGVHACTDIFREIDAECLVDPTAAATGTTASVVVVRGTKLLTANIGDSRAVMSVKGQAIDIMGVQHPGREDERSRIEKAGGWVVEEQELHMNKLHGMDLNDPLIEQKANRVEFEITPEIEFFVLACDGLWDTITSQEAVTHVREKLLQNLSMKDISYSLADLAIRSGSLDNVSVVVTLLQDRSSIT